MARFTPSPILIVLFIFYFFFFFLGGGGFLQAKSRIHPTCLDSLLCFFMTCGHMWMAKSWFLAGWNEGMS